VPVSTQLTFDANTSRACANVSVPNDGVVEGPENLVVVLDATGPPDDIRLDPSMAIININESESKLDRDIVYVCMHVYMHISILTKWCHLKA